MKGVVDGDTVRLLIDLGYRSYGEHSIRLTGIAAPRIYRVEEEERQQGLLARDFVDTWFERHGRYSCGGNNPWPYMVRSISSESFGRYMGEIFCLKGHCLNDELLQTGHAKPYKREEQGWQLQ